MKQVVVLISGGIDSSVLLYKMVADGYECWPLTILYGQKHTREVEASKRVCELKDVGLVERWKRVDLQNLGELLPSALTQSDVEVPEGVYTPESQALTVVPNRNMIFLSIAAGYAQGIGVGCVAYAAHRNDQTVYPDCRPSFVSAAAECIREATGDIVTLVAPFVHLTKAEVVRYGVTYRVPFSVTYSCYNGRERPCLKCGTCVERTLAFQEVGLPDPALSSDAWQEALKHVKR